MAYIEPHLVPEPILSDERRRRQRPVYDVLVEAAWHVLSPFFDPADFNVLLPEVDPSTGLAVTKDDGQPLVRSVPMNKNVHWEYAFRRTNVRYNDDGAIIAASEDDLFDGEVTVGDCRLHKVTKRHLNEHLWGMPVKDTNVPTVLYYRSAANARFRVGYGSRSKQPRLAKTDYAKFLRVSQGVVRSQRFNAVLWCIDIDFKPERYACGTRNDSAEVRDWIVGTYFAGAYSEPSTSGNGMHVYLKLAYANDGNPAETHAAIVEALRHFLRFLDGERRARGFVADVDVAVCGVPSCVHVDAKGRFRSITRSQCVKLPNFVANANTFRRLRNVARFHLAPVFFLRAVQTPLPRTQSSAAAGASPVLIDALTPSVSETQRAGSGDDPPHDPTQALIEGWVQAGCVSWDDVGRSAKRRTRGSKTLEQGLVPIRAIEEAVPRCREFYGLLNRHANRVLAPEEVNGEYVKHGLNRTGNHERRMSLWKSMFDYFVTNFRPTKKKMPPMDDFPEYRSRYEAAVAERVNTAGLGYHKARGKGKKKVFKGVAVEEVAAIYYVIETLHDATGQAFLGYRDAQEQYRRLLGRSADPNRIGCILRALKQSGMLRVVVVGRWDTRQASTYEPLVRVRRADVAGTRREGGVAA